jgi:hypothetical protein
MFSLELVIAVLVGAAVLGLLVWKAGRSCTP